MTLLPSPPQQNSSTKTFAQLRKQGFYTAYAVIALPNSPSVALHENLGFEQVELYGKGGFKHGKWRDVGHWKLLLQPPEVPPSPPTPSEELRPSDGINEALRTSAATLRL